MTEYYSALGAAQAPIILGQYSLGLPKQLWIITRSDRYNRVCDRVHSASGADSLCAKPGVAGLFRDRSGFSDARFFQILTLFVIVW